MDDFVNNGINMLPELGININTLIFRTGLTQVYQRYIISDVADEEMRE